MFRKIYIQGISWFHIHIFFSEICDYYCYKEIFYLFKKKIIKFQHHILYIIAIVVVGGTFTLSKPQYLGAVIIMDWSDLVLPNHDPGPGENICMWAASHS